MERRLETDGEENVEYDDCRCIEETGVIGSKGDFSSTVGPFFADKGNSDRKLKTKNKQTITTMQMVR